MNSTAMTYRDRIYTFLCIFFSVLVVMGNLIYQKFVTLSFLGFVQFELSVGAILYPLTFLLTDLLAEFYGKTKARFCVRMAMLMNICAAVILFILDNLEATHWSTVSAETFHHVFGMYSVAFTGSLLACYIAQTVDIVLYLWIRKITRGRYLWVRNLGSTAVSLFVDTTIVITFLVLFNVLPKDQWFKLISNSYAFKLCFTVINIPIFYLCVKGIRRLFLRDAI